MKRFKLSMTLFTLIGAMAGIVISELVINNLPIKIDMLKMGLYYVIPVFMAVAGGAISEFIFLRKGSIRDKAQKKCVAISLIVTILGSFLLGFGGQAIYDADIDLGRTGSKNVVMAIDCSGSMDGDYIKNAVLSAQEAVDALNAGDKLSVVLFRGTAEKLLDMTKITNENRERIKQKISTISATGGSDMNKAIEMIIENSNCHVIAITDADVRFNPDWKNKFIKQNISFYMMHIVSSDGGKKNTSIEDVCLATGGSYVMSSEPSDIQSIVAGFVNNIKNSAETSYINRPIDVREKLPNWYYSIVHMVFCALFGTLLMICYKLLVNRKDIGFLYNFFVALLIGGIMEVLYLIFGYESEWFVLTPIFLLAVCTTGYVYSTNEKNVKKIVKSKEDIIDGSDITDNPRFS